MTRLTRLLFSTLLPVSAICGTGLFCPPATRAESPARKASDFASGAGNILFLGAALGLPLLSDGKDGRNHALRAADAIGTSVLLVALISYSRVHLHRHYDRDMIAGALIGYGTARLELAAPRGLVLSPLILSDSHSYDLQVSSAWR